MLDPRIGSGDLDQPLQALGLPVQVTPLDFGDAVFLGRGPEGCPVPIGIEIKTLKDLLSCITTGRFAGHQLPGLVQTFDEIWLVVEGIYRPNPRDGVLEMLQRGGWLPVELASRRWMYRDLDHFLTTMEVRAGIRVRRTQDRHETGRTIASLYSWWQKDYEDHHAHLTIHRAPRDTALLTTPSLAHEVAACLPGLGYLKAGAAAAHFSGSVRSMINASPKDWMQIPGIGKTLAAKITEAIA